MIEIAPNRFINRKRIVGANIYTKDNVIRVAITMDTINKEEATCFSGTMETTEQARNFIGNLIE